ncbi:hypothetical protein [Curtobacterium sp. NPDC089185]|uniref:hypothetical protein n=1 Tax=Curtobacterium sp. NPDC089185 TaxID=3154968 RepID=UPI003441C83A
MQIDATGTMPWRPVTPDDVPMHAVVRYEDRGRSVLGTAVDVLDAHGRPSLIVLDDDGQRHVAPCDATLEMRVD